MAADDLLFVVLIGHGTFDGVDAKFNLVGPDLESAEWAGLVRGLPGRIVWSTRRPRAFHSSSASAGPRRIVDRRDRFGRAAVRHGLPRVFHRRASATKPSDIDKNGRISIWEAFAAAAGGVRRHYQQRGQLATERSLLDDNGDGVGREAAPQGDDGSLASRTYLDAPSPERRRPTRCWSSCCSAARRSMAEVEELQIKKAFMAPDEYAREFERIMLALARIARDIRGRVKS